MDKREVRSKSAPAALGPYSQGVVVGQTVYLSGQIGLDPATGSLVYGIEAQTHQAFRNLQAVARSAGGDMNDLVKVTILLADMSDFKMVNEIMTGYFTRPYPARSTFQVAALPKDAEIEIEAIMMLRNA